MGLFSRKTSIEKQNLLNGFTDWHSHILPGVDDGVKSLDESLEILALYEVKGVKNVWLTPHIMEDIPNKTSDLQTRFEELKAAYKGTIKLNLAAEYMIDNLFEERLENGDLLPLGTECRHLLVETSYYSAPANFLQIIRQIKSKGFFPVLAHPERYLYMDDDYYRRLLDMDVIFQMNLFSSLGSYGETARKKVSKLLKMQKSDANMRIELPVTGDTTTPTGSSAISLLGTDVHSISQIRKNLDRKEMSTSIASETAKILHPVSA